MERDRSTAASGFCHGAGCRACHLGGTLVDIDRRRVSDAHVHGDLVCHVLGGAVLEYGGRGV